MSARPWGERRWPRLARYVALWLGLGVLSAAFVAAGLPIAGPNAVLAVAVATFSGMVGLALLHLGILRFMIFGRALELIVGAAFGCLALANLAVRIVIPASRRLPVTEDTGLDLLLLVGVLSAGLFLAGLTIGNRSIDRPRRARFATRLGALIAAVLILGVAIIVAVGDRLPATVAPESRQLIADNVVIYGALPGQAPWLLVADGLISLLLLAATIGYAWQAERLADRYLSMLSVVLAFLLFGQLHTLLFPPMVDDFVSTATGFRVVAYTLLVLALLGRIGQDIVAAAAGEERLRLSRELHDGLTQQLNLLNLRLGLATDLERPVERRAEDLERSQHIVELAIIEARHVIAALRSGAVSWQELRSTLERFADDFEANHGVTIEMTTEGTACLETEQQLELLRILHEACSNALRHGNAARIEISVSERPGWLDLQISDDGSGFDPTRLDEQRGIGLRSMHERAMQRGGTLSISTRSGMGTTVRAALPIVKTAEERRRDGRRT